MNIPPLMFPAKPPRRRKRRDESAAPPAAPLTMVYWYADWGGITVTLEFDRAIDIGALDASAITVDDPANSGSALVGSGAGVLVHPMRVRVTMVDDGVAVGSITTLSATAGSGIVAVDDGG